MYKHREKTDHQEDQTIRTKDRILLEALNLFSQDGYEGVSIKRIADAVGIKDSSLYKHYTSKKEIFQSILEKMQEEMGQLGIRLHLPDMTEIQKEHIEECGQLNVDYLIQITKEAYLFYLKDEIASKCRRMLLIEQYHSTEAATIFRKIFLEDSIKYQAAIFQSLTDAGFLRKADPEQMALYYYTPIYYLLARYDNRPEKEEEAISYIERHVREFVILYQK